MEEEKPKLLSKSKNYSARGVLLVSEKKRVQVGGEPVYDSLVNWVEDRPKRPFKESIICLLGEGHSIKKVTEIKKSNEGRIRKIAQRAVKDGYLEQPHKNHAFYTKGKLDITFSAKQKNLDRGQKQRTIPSTINEPLNSPEHNTPLIPHRYDIHFNRGSNFLPPNLIPCKRKNWFSYKDTQGSLKAFWNTKSVVIWIKKHGKGSPTELLQRGLKQANLYTQSFPQARLTFKKVGRRIEWAVNDETLAKYIKKVFGLKAGEQRTIEKSNYVANDGSGDTLEINKDKDFEPEEPLNHTLRLHKIVSGQFDKTNKEELKELKEEQKFNREERKESMKIVRLYAEQMQLHLKVEERTNKLQDNANKIQERTNETLEQMQKTLKKIETVNKKVKNGN